MKNTLMSLTLLLALAPAAAATLQVMDDASGRPLPMVMLRVFPLKAPALPSSDGGYPPPGKPFDVWREHSVFSDAEGRAELPDQPASAPQQQLRLRKPGYQDLTLPLAAVKGPLRLKRETDPLRLAEAKPANAWLGALELGDPARRLHFQTQCTFCHQQGNAALRRERSEQEWSEAIQRMLRYGARLSSEDQQALPAILAKGYQALREHPERVGETAPWASELAQARISEWPVGDAMSQAHDVLLARDGTLYVADNIQDRLWALDPRSGRMTVHKIPHLPGDEPGGLLSARLREFPRHDSTSNAHSLAESARDGHIFITPSAQRRIVEFDPAKAEFRLHEIGGGFYPHTIRIDAQDRVWFTLALSNQVGMLDRTSGRFKLYDLPARSFGERMTTRYIGALYWLMRQGVPLTNWLKVDRAGTGTPLPYGIDITPDGRVWIARLHTDEIGVIDPRTDEVRMIATPFKGPRRLRADAQGRLWIAAFPESAVVCYDPASGRFTRYDLPVKPKGSDTPYSLNVDKVRGVVWVNGNQSDSLYALEIASGRWTQYPLPRRVAFTRDVEIAPDGSVYTSTSSFPSWHVEDGQPTLIHLQPR
ncbi:Vgb family protein [Paucibacter soli]|uniref:Vgb family protein n=1 Tax=Paucibacter soli TaxID=3133433 RepID=UPI0030A49F35